MLSCSKCNSPILHIPSFLADACDIICTNCTYQPEEAMARSEARRIPPENLDDPKTCPECGMTKTVNDFSRAGDNTNRRRHRTCKKCESARKRISDDKRRRNA